MRTECTYAVDKRCKQTVDLSSTINLLSDSYVLFVIDDRLDAIVAIDRVAGAFLDSRLSRAITDYIERSCFTCNL